MAGPVESLDIDERDLHLLPKTMQDLAAVIGLPALLKLVEAYGGVPVYVPVRLSSNWDLRDLLGDEAFFKLIDKHAGQRMEIPRCAKALRYIMYRKIRTESLTTSQRDLALRYRYTIRHIRNIEMMGEPEEDLNGSLF
jgi:hypothetical protein